VKINNTKKNNKKTNKKQRETYGIGRQTNGRTELVMRDVKMSALLCYTVLYGSYIAPL